MAKQKVVIVGGGFGGVKAALELAKDNRFSITLITDRPVFYYYPTLYRTATGGIKNQSAIPLKTIFSGKQIKLVINRVLTIDRRAKTVSTDKKTYEYDTVILALGVVTNYFGIEGLKKHSFGIKSMHEVEELKEHIHKQLVVEGKPDLRYVIVGAGPTGVELAGALPNYIYSLMKKYDIKQRRVHVDLVEGATRVLPRMPKSTSRVVARRLRTLGVKLHLGKAVHGATADALVVGDKKLLSRTIIWTAGIANNPFFTENKFSFGPRGKVAVNVYLEADDNIYVIGDNANTPYSGMAQTAVYDGAFVARNLRRIASGRDPKPYKPKKPIYVTPVGYGWAAVLWGKLEIFGVIGYFLRQAADARAFGEIQPLTNAARQWFTEFEDDDYSFKSAKQPVAIKD